MKIESLLDLLHEISNLEEMTYWGVEDFLDSKGLENIRLHDGATKLCLVCPNKDFVIKWDFHRGGKNVKKEVFFYEEAVRKGVACFFPRTTIFAEYNGYTFIKQEKIDIAVCDISYKDRATYEKIGSSVSDKILQKMIKGFVLPDCDYSRQLDPTWARVVISIYGKKLAKKLCEFIQENYISDLHKGNIGYKKHRPMILDFSGYFGSDSSYYWEEESEADNFSENFK